MTPLEQSAIRALGHAMKVRGVTRADLARGLELHPGRITNVLNGRETNLTFRSYGRMLAALGYEAEITLRDLR